MHLGFQSSYKPDSFSGIHQNHRFRQIPLKELNRPSAGPGAEIQLILRAVYLSADDARMRVVSVLYPCRNEGRACACHIGDVLAFITDEDVL